MSRTAALRDHDDTPDADHIIVFHDVSWEDYERVLEMRGDRSAPAHPVSRAIWVGPRFPVTLSDGDRR